MTWRTASHRLSFGRGDLEAICGDFRSRSQACRASDRRTYLRHIRATVQAPGASRTGLQEVYLRAPLCTQLFHASLRVEFQWRSKACARRRHRPQTPHGRICILRGSPSHPGTPPRQWEKRFAALRSIRRRSGTKSPRRRKTSPARGPGVSSRNICHTTGISKKCRHRVPVRGAAMRPGRLLPLRFQSVCYAYARSDNDMGSTRFCFYMLVQSFLRGRFPFDPSWQ